MHLSLPQQSPRAGSKGPTKKRKASDFKIDENVFVFYRFQQSQEELFMPVDTIQGGTCSPRIGQSDGWQTGRILELGKSNESVFVEYTHPLWFDRHGQKLDRNRDIEMLREWVDVVQLRKIEDGSPPRPELSFFVVRWGGEEQCDPVCESDSGWGRTGSNVSDPYMAVLFEETVWPYLGPTYQVITCFVASSADLNRITPSLIVPQLTGTHKVAMFFLWPVTYQDAPVNQPGYVNNNALLDLMARVESCGVIPRFPHYSHLYKLLTSKCWMAHLSLMPELFVPATTKLSVALIHRDPKSAARTALIALRNIQCMKYRLEADDKKRLPPIHQIKGVVKVGFSWEASGVKIFDGEEELACQLRSLAEQPDALHDAVMVTEYVTFTVELRLFLVNEGRIEWDPQTQAPRPARPKKIIYTRFDTVNDDNMVIDFRRLQRQTVIDECFEGDSASLIDAENKAAGLAGRILFWLQTECAEPPPVMRLDFMANRVGEGKSSVATGEITELGGCFLGWKEGPDVVWRAVLQSCFRPGKRVLADPTKKPYQIWRRVNSLMLDAEDREAATRECTPSQQIER